MSERRSKIRQAFDYVSVAAFMFLHITKGELTPAQRQRLLHLATRNTDETSQRLGAPSEAVDRVLRYINSKRKEAKQPRMRLEDLKRALSTYILSMVLEKAILEPAAFEIESAFTHLHGSPGTTKVTIDSFESALSEEAASPLAEGPAGRKEKG